MLYFINKGEIDPRAIKTFGVNVKESENPIGFFGTGMKYAVAITLRLGGKIDIWSGETHYRLETAPVNIRDKEFNVVTMNGEELGFTTELGKTWEPWQAFRELACNAYDEGGDVYDVPPPKTTTGMTVIRVSSPELEEVFYNQHRYFFHKNPLETFHKDPMLEVKRGVSDVVFYRGIQAGAFPRSTAYTYNVLKQCALTEDRTFKSIFDAGYFILKSIVQSTDKEFIKGVLTCSPTCWESTANFPLMQTYVGETFLQVVGSMNFSDITNNSVLTLYDSLKNAHFRPTPANLTDIQRKQLKKAVDFCYELGFPVDTYPVYVTADLKHGVLGMAYKEEIFIAVQTFDMGTKRVATTLIEEFLHVSKGLDDESREMQNYLFDLIGTLGERVLGEPL